MTVKKRLRFRFPFFPESFFSRLAFQQSGMRFFYLSRFRIAPLSGQKQLAVAASRGSRTPFRPAKPSARRFFQKKDRSCVSFSCL